MQGSTFSAVSTRFLILSDTHNFDINDSELKEHPLNQPLPAVDVVLHCGDLTHCGGVSSYKKAIKMLASIDAKLKLVIGGNHDLDLDKQYWLTHLDEGDEPEDHDNAMDVMKGTLAAEAGVTYLEEGTHTFTLENGSKLTVYASPYTPAFNDMAFPYDHDADRFNNEQDVIPGARSIAKNPIPNFGEVDVIMTHGPPKGILDHCPQGDAGCPNLLQAVSRARPLLHCFGHIHEGSGAKLMNWLSLGSGAEGLIENQYPEPIAVQPTYGNTSLMLNAAINDGANKPKNAPWLVDLHLPQAH